MMEAFQTENRIFPGPAAGTLRWLWFFITPHKASFVLLTANRFLRRLFYCGVEPLLVGKVIALFTTGEAFLHLEKLWLLAVIYVVGSVFASLLLLLSTGEGRFHDRVAREGRLMGLAHLNAMPADWHESVESGTKMQKIMNGSAGGQALVRIYFRYVLNFIGAFGGICIALVGMDAPWFYMPLFFMMMTSYMALAWWTGTFVEKGFDAQNTLMERLVGRIYEFANAPLAVKVLNLGAYMLGKARHEEEAGATQIRRVFFLDYGQWILLNLMGLFWVVSIVSIALYQTLHHQMALAVMILILYKVPDIWGMLEEFVGVYGQYIEQSSAFRRLTDFLSLSVPPVNALAKPLELEKGGIVFEKVGFAYDPAHTVFKGFNLTVRPHEKVGLVGYSGAGKSTLVKLLLQLYPAEGCIRLDGQDIRDVTPESLREAIALIPQDVVLFNQSVRENIRCGRMEARDDEVEEAARLASANVFIADLPQGYETLIGERGTKLSGGQRQRIAIARAILKNAPILILDEATSALDSESEYLIQQSLAKLMEGKTVIAIAHRLSTLACMDRLVVLDKGQIVEDGTHAELLAKGGIYAHLWALQSGGFLPEE